MTLRQYGKLDKDGEKRKSLNRKANKLATWLLGLPRFVKKSIFLFSDYFISTLSLYLAFSLRSTKLIDNTSFFFIAIWSSIPIIWLYFSGFYRGVNRVFFDTDMRKVLYIFTIIITSIFILNIFNIFSKIPDYVPFVHLFLLFIWLWHSRLISRDLLARWLGKPKAISKNSKDFDNVIIYGAGSSGTELYKGLKVSNTYNVVGFIDDDLRLSSGRLLGVQIYPTTIVKKIVNDLDVAQIFLAMPSVSRARRRQIIDGLSDLSVKIKELPSLQELAEGKVTVSTMHRVDILDVLNRQTAEPNQILLRKNINNKNVLVTGAGGSIGSELCRQIMKSKPNCLVLYELSEYALYAIHQELLEYKKNVTNMGQVEIMAVLGNVRNEDKLHGIFKSYTIQTVYHAAAYKHVPLVEHNPFEGVINNVKGTFHCAKAAIKANVETFVLISTDKAVRPTNIMGASKRLAELVCQGLSKELPIATCTHISMVRFGNVLGSSGSVVPLFTKQIEQGGPITVTHPDVTRYFMTIPEAANLVIQAGAMAQGGEVFVLDMGNPIKIVDLARRMVHLSGHEIKDDQNPDGDIEIIFSGLRPGEKLYEELIIGEDNIEDTQHPLIMQAMEHNFELKEVEEFIMNLERKDKRQDTEWLKTQFRYFVEGYQSD